MTGTLINLATLTLRLTQREFISRYRGSALGLLWSIVTPLAMLSIYTFIFTYVFKTTWTGAGGTSEYAVNIFIGLIFHLQLVETFGSSAYSIISHPNYIKKVVFPIGILPIVQILNIFAHTIISVVILFGFIIALNGSLPLAGAIDFLILVALHIFMCLALSWIIGGIGVYFRDIAHALSLISMVLLFMSPVFYSLDRVPERFRWIMKINPNTFFIFKGRSLLLGGGHLHLITLIWLTALLGLLCVVSYKIFKHLQRGFADVI